MEKTDASSINQDLKDKNLHLSSNLAAATVIDTVLNYSLTLT